MKNKYKTYATLTAIVHSCIAIVFAICIYLILFSKAARIYASLFCLSVGILYLLFKGCTLTQLEQYFLKKAGHKNKLTFLERVIIKFKIEKLFDVVMITTILVSAIIVLYDLVKLLNALRW